MSAPNCFLVGAHKGGTTSLFFHLRQHPEIFMSAVKEPEFLSPMARRGFAVASGGAGTRPATRADYDALFRDAAGRPVCGEASTIYLYDPDAAGEIRAVSPDARILAVLRNPTERAYSNYQFARRDGKEPLASFASALAAEDARVEQGWAPLWHYRRKGHYGTQLGRYLETFPRSRVHVILSDDLRSDPRAALAGVFRFLGVDDQFAPDLGTEHNRSGRPRSALLHGLTNRPNLVKSTLKRLLPAQLRTTLTGSVLARLRNANLARPEPMAGAIRAELTAHYRDEVLALQDMIGRDLRSWL